LQRCGQSTTIGEVNEVDNPELKNQETPPLVKLFHLWKLGNNLKICTSPYFAQNSAPKEIYAATSFYHHL
jgi:hypothetical protein